MPENEIQRKHKNEISNRADINEIEKDNIEKSMKLILRSVKLISSSQSNQGGSGEREDT